MNVSDRPAAATRPNVADRLHTRKAHAVDYSLSAPHGWEFLLDNHLEKETDRREAVTHVAVLGEN